MKHKTSFRESLPGIILLATAGLAMILSNSSYADIYFANLNHFVVNDILMTIFFLYVGLEIKHQIVIGHLSKPGQILLPTVSAIGGVILPAIIFVFINDGNNIALKGWAIPIATDIAFALGVITLLGHRIPLELRVLLLTISVLDDLLAIIIITAFYTQQINITYLLLSVIPVIVLLFFNYLHIKNIVHYLMLGALLWFFLFKTGIHPTLSGVATALAIPTTAIQPLHRKLYFWVSYVILPLFAFTNAGLSLNGINAGAILHPITLGIILGLVLGKPLGVFSFAWLSINLKLSALPQGISWKQLCGMAIICGIGFTMSIFIGNLAYRQDAIYLMENKLGVLLGSTISATIGYLFLRYACKGK